DAVHQGPRFRKLTRDAVVLRSREFAMRARARTHARTYFYMGTIQGLWFPSVRLRARARR
ncbi:MAG TPA: hypothetical protein VET25_00790, partial [Aestuariivirgaceae bacterium]|nr:hypothetical protein [Aestuariivirgaceae bacterium]